MNTSKHPRTGSRGANHMLTVDEILEDLGEVSRRTFYEWRAKGTGPRCVKLPNGELRVRRAEYEPTPGTLGVSAFPRRSTSCVPCVFASLFSW
jgi:predicted DNA-binding transcriptional regulator AlpA